MRMAGRCDADCKSDGGGEKLRGGRGLVASLACMVFGNGTPSRPQQLRRELERHSLRKGIWFPEPSQMWLEKASARDSCLFRLVAFSEAQSRQRREGEASWGDVSDARVGRRRRHCRQILKVRVS